MKNEQDPDKHPCFWDKTCALTPRMLRVIQWESWRNGFVTGIVICAIATLVGAYLDKLFR